ncbi:PREDICTED: uncharacterized protein LOC109470587 [Branchiostoma belcheri]|uniref:Alkaline phosphatase n=1 Tax=Branchiostoma belcheri TaxID=7741 RepID=A0A6P4Y7V5_BRABE|nr:PREDICTED: uncharacterized protein LOC109470587 [Branchiostoma belcheri]
MARVHSTAGLFLTVVFIATSFGKPAYDDSSNEDHSAHLRARSAHAQSRATAPTDQERTPEYWSDMARASLAAALRLQTLNTNVAKNVVLFLGDGMGVSTVTTARILKGQKAGNPGEEAVLAMDSLPYTAMSKTYNIDAQVPDSAGTATAFLCGVKAESGVVGVDGKTRYGNCSSSKGREVESIIVHAERAGKSTGIVTTARVTHATPAAAYAHSAARGWEADSDLTAEARDNNCTDIAYQLVEEAPDIEVIMGGGRRMFTPRSMADPESGSGDRDDGVDLIQRWQDGKSGTARYVWNGTDFRDVDPDSTDYLLGLFERSHMKYSADRTSDPAEEPTIADMTRKAIQILQKNPNGFFLLVEGGRIDHGHHGATAVKALEDTVAFDDAVQVAKDMLSTSDSLIVVTADHSHTLAFAGYPDRGHPIFGKNVYRYSTPDNDWDGLPYTTLLYGNGAGYGLEETTRGNDTHVTRQNITDVNTADKEYRQQSAVPLRSETHAGEDVIIMADGPMAHLFHGVQEQHYIAHVMMYAACLGEYTDHCDKPATPKPVRDAGTAARGSLYTVGLTAVLCGLQMLAGTRFYRKAHLVNCTERLKKSCVFLNSLPMMDAEKLLGVGHDGSHRHRERGPGPPGSLVTVLSVAAALVLVVSLVAVMQGRAQVTSLEIELSSLKIQLEVEREEKSRTDIEVLNLKERLLKREEEKDVAALKERLAKLESKIQGDDDLGQSLSFSTNEELELSDNSDIGSNHDDGDDVDQDDTRDTDTPWQLWDELHDRAKRSSVSTNTDSDVYNERRREQVENERTPEYWSDMARASLSAALRLQTLNTNVAKNVVLFLGDGMGVSTVTTARILKGQKAGNPGEETVLAMDSLPYTAMSKTYSIDRQVPESSACATAFLCGVKTNRGLVGLDGRATSKNCSSAKGHEVASILVHAERAGKSTGIVTTTRVTHATPAAAYAHSAARGWEADNKLTAEARDNNCTDIAYQLVEEAPDIEVILGGGRQAFLTNNMADPEDGTRGHRTDSRDLIRRWLDRKTGPARYVWNQTEFNSVDPESVDYLLGLFEPNHMRYSVDRPNDTAGEPSLADMTRKAIQILQKNQKGFFLLVEGGRIDHAHHSSKAVKALEDTLAFDDAVQVAKDMLSTSDSLIVVTADHSHTLAFAGDPDRGHPIFGKLETSRVLDDLPYTTLLYGTGPGHNINGNRHNITDVDTADKEYRQQSAVPMRTETHGGDDVIIMADGPMAHLFHGVQEQHYIAHVIMYAACVGEYTHGCDMRTPPVNPRPSKSAGNTRVARGGTYVITLVITIACSLSVLF